MRFLVLLLVVALLAMAGSYAILNVDERADVSLPWMELRGVHQVYLVLASAAVGALFMGVLSLVDGIRLRLSMRRLQREIEMLRDEVPAPAGAPDPAGGSPRPRGPFRGGSGEPATRPIIPPAGSSSSTDDTPPYGI